MTETPKTPLTTYFKSLSEQLKVALSAFIDTSKISVQCTENDYDEGFWMLPVVITHKQANGADNIIASSYIRFKKDASNDEMGDAAEGVMKTIISQALTYSLSNHMCSVNSQGVFKTSTPKQTDSGVFIDTPKCIKLFDD